MYVWDDICLRSFVERVWSMHDESKLACLRGVTCNVTAAIL